MVSSELLLCAREVTQSFSDAGQTSQLAAGRRGNIERKKLFKTHTVNGKEECASTHQLHQTTRLTW